MTFSDLIRETRELSLRNPAFKSDIRGWINRGQRAIAERRNWTWMHARESVTITAGTTSANFPARFKQLSNEKSPISFTAPGQSFPTPVQVLSREQLERMSPGQFGNVVNTSGAWSPFYVFIEKNGGLWTINVPAQYPYAANATYEVSCFLYPADLALGTDHNDLTDNSELAEALMNWVRWKALPAAEPEGRACKAAFEEAIETAAISDSRQKLGGRAIHM